MAFMIFMHHFTFDKPCRTFLIQVLLFLDTTGGEIIKKNAKIGNSNQESAKSEPKNDG